MFVRLVTNFVNEVNARDNIAPLVTSTNLNGTTVITAQFAKILGL